MLGFKGDQDERRETRTRVLLKRGPIPSHLQPHKLTRMLIFQHAGSCTETKMSERGNKTKACICANLCGSKGLEQSKSSEAETEASRSKCSGRAAVVELG